MEETLGGSHIIIEVVACSMERLYGGAREWGLGKEGKRIGFDVGTPKPCVKFQLATREFTQSL